jgi:hypothetical protein
MNLIQVPSERRHRLAHIHTEAPPTLMIQVPPAPQCPNCSREMVLSHKFYAEPGGPQMWHFHCTVCKVGLTQAEQEDPPASSPK